MRQFNWLRNTGISALAILQLALSGCSRSNSDLAGRGSIVGETVAASVSRLRFENATQETQLDFTYRSGSQPSSAPILMEVGGGCGLIDMDRDGALDAFFPGGGFLSELGPQSVSHGFFINLGNGTFRDVAMSSGLFMSRFYSHGVAASDFDADGFPDLLVTGYGGLQFFRNQGDGTFTECAETAGLTNALWGSSAGWGDVNGDGNPDLFVCHYVNWSQENDPVCHGPTVELLDSCSPDAFLGLPDTLYLSDGQGEFGDISKKAGLRDDGKGLGVVLGDLDADGDVDIYVANDGVGNFVYRNDGTESDGIPRFCEVGTISGAALSESGTADASMGIAVLNLNEDSLPDLWVSNFEFESPGVYRNEGGMAFTHIARRAGVGSRTNTYVSFGTAAADFDGDGDDDVLVTNGHISRYPRSKLVQQPCQLFENLGRSQFRDSASLAGQCLLRPLLGRGLTIGDLDGDGDLDAIVSPRDEPVQVFRNSQMAVSQWLTISLVGTESARDGGGAVIRAKTNTGTIHKWIFGGMSYLSTSTLDVTIPDDPSNSVIELEVTWPNRRAQRLQKNFDNLTYRWTTDSGRFTIHRRRLTVVQPLPE